MTRPVDLFLLAGFAFVAASCSDGDGGDGPNDVTVLHETCPADLCADPPDCGSDEVASCCTCIKIPVQDSIQTGCDEMGEYCATTPGQPDIACLLPDGYPTWDAPGDATVHGPVDVYATGLDSDGVLVQIYELDETGNIGSLVGEFASDDTCSAHEDLGEFPTYFESVDEVADCPGPCLEKLSAEPGNHDCRQLGYYSIDGVPTNTPLIVKTSQDGGGTLWKDMLSFNIWFFDEQIGADGGVAGHVFYKARCVSTDDWRNIPVAAGDTNGIAPGYGAVAGEVHDCSDVRLGFAMAATFPDANVLTYFNGIEEHLYPDRLRNGYGTNIDGLYAAMEIVADPAGSPIYISALAQVASVGVVSLGWQKAFVYPETLTSVTLRGTRPDQVD